MICVTASKPVIGVPGEDDAIEAALGLGDLAGLTVNNEADPLTYDVSIERSIFSLIKKYFIYFLKAGTAFGSVEKHTVA